MTRAAPPRRRSARASAGSSPRSPLRARAPAARRLAPRRARSAFPALLIALLLGAPLALPGSASAAGTVATLPPLAGDAALEARLLAEGNRARTAAGAGALVPDERLALAARHHAEEMARLGYLSHASPTPGRATLGERVSAAGSPMVGLGENLARVGEADPAAAAVRGWLDSPGHRTNLLDPRFTHVGYGTAVTPDGAVVIAQVLGERRASLIGASVRAETRERLELRVELRAERTLRAAFSLGGAPGPVHELPAGPSRVVLGTAPAERLHLLVGVELTPGAGYVADEGGWLEPGAAPWERWRPDATAHRELVEIVSVEPALERARVARVELIYDGAAGRELALFVDEEHAPGAWTGGGRLVADVPLVDGVALLVGEALPDGRVSVFHRFTLDASGGAPTLRAGSG